MNAHHGDNGWKGNPIGMTPLIFSIMIENDIVKQHHHMGSDAFDISFKGLIGRTGVGNGVINLKLMFQAGHDLSEEAVFGTERQNPEPAVTKDRRAK